MSDTKFISLTTQRFYATRVFVTQTLMWTYLVGAEGLSHWWFGGSWVIDLMVLLVMVTLAIAFGVKHTGFSVPMTKDDIRAWVLADMPLDVKEWKAARGAKKIN